jgi:hypothetical protein
MVVGQNRAVVSTAGTLATATATATDQYGVGIAGVSVTFDTNTLKNAALTAEAATDTKRSTLITNSSGVATYSGVVCDSASVGLSGSVAFSIDDEAGSIEMSDTAATPASATIEGTTITCVTAGVDGGSQTATTGTINAVVANEISTFVFTLDADDSALDPKTGSTFTITVGDATTCGATFTTAAIDGDAADTAIKSAIELLTCVTTVTIGLTGSGTTWTGFTVAHLANTGDWPDMTVTEVVALTPHTGGAADASVAVSTTTTGAYGTTFDHIDHDATANTLTAKRTVLQRTAAGAAVVTTDYSEWGYDDTDAFNTASLLGASMAQWEAALTADAGTSATDLSIAYRIAAAGSGVSSFKLG